jgi:hypothetical protein
MILDQGMLKEATRIVMKEYGADHPVVAALKSAWNNDDEAEHERAWAALSRLGTAHRTRIWMQAKESVQTDKWLGDLLTKR